MNRLIHKLVRRPFVAALLLTPFLLPGCATPPPQTPQAAVHPVKSLKIVGLQVNPNPLTASIADWASGNVFVSFNGAAPTGGIVRIKATPPGWTVARSVGSNGFNAGDTGARVQVGFFSPQSANVPLQALIDGKPASAGYKSSVFVQIPSS